MDDQVEVSYDPMIGIGITSPERDVKQVHHFLGAASG
jgi:hypothetical protein